MSGAVRKDCTRGVEGGYHMLSMHVMNGHRMWSRRLAAVASAAAIAGSMLVAVATSAAPAGAASASGTPIVIGDLCSCTGIQASSVELSTPTDQAWVKSVNAHGGIAGHPVTLISADDQTNPAVATTDIGKFIETDHVAAIIDNSQEDSAWISDAVSAGVPVIGGVNSVLGYTNPDVFPSGSTLNYGIAGEDAGAAEGRDQDRSHLLLRRSGLLQADHRSGGQGRAAVRHQGRLHLGHLLHGAELHGPMCGGQSDRCRFAGNGRRQHRRREGGRQLCHTGLEPGRGHRDERNRQRDGHRSHVQDDDRFHERHPVGGP